LAYETIIVEKRGRVLYVTMNRPESLNARNRQLGREVDEVFLDFHNDDETWVAVLRGAGRAFCAGADLKEMATGPGAVPPQRPIPSFFFGTLPLVKPTIAAIHGYALGGGLELAMACDLLIASEEAQLGLPEVRRGINPGPGIHHLMRRMPYAVALRYLMTGAHMAAPQAYQYGLVNRVVPRDQLDQAVDEIVNELLEAAPLAVRAVKETALRGFNVPLSAALALTGPRWLMDTADSKEGPRAFAEKRKPNWQGR
jgi:crotonobetainyl-CoA hydratase/dehydration protein DpgD